MRSEPISKYFIGRPNMNTYTNKFNSICQTLSIFWGASQTLIVMQAAWFSAFFHGLNTGIWTATIDINLHGEAYLELLLWCIMTPVILYGSYLNIKLIYKVYEENN